MSALRTLRQGLCIVSTLIAMVPAGAGAQQSCAELDAVLLQCPQLESIAGEPPFCFCDGVRIEQLELTCASNFGCASGDEIGTGEWPKCSCTAIGPDGPGEGGGSGPDTPQPGTGLGGAETCKQFFSCPSGSRMGVDGGQCVCEAVMLPQFNE